MLCEYAQICKKIFSINLFAIATGVYTSAIPFGAGTGISVTRPLSGFGPRLAGVFWLWSLAAVPFIDLDISGA